MNVAYIETIRRGSDSLAEALAALTEAGIEFEVVCSGPDESCPDLHSSAAA